MLHLLGGNIQTDWYGHSQHIVGATCTPERKVGCKITLTGVSVTMPRRGSADSVLSWRTSDTSLDLNSDIRQGSGSRQSRDLPVDGKKLVIRQPIKENNTSGGEKNESCHTYSSLSFGFPFSPLGVSGFPSLSR